MSKVYILLLNYNGWQDTIECLESVLKSDYKNYQVIVVDNDSPNNSMSYIINWLEGREEVNYDKNSKLKHLSQPLEPKPLQYVYYTKEEALNGGSKKVEKELTNPIILIQAGENGGFAAGNNIGIKYALSKNDFENICLLNNDTVVNPNYLSIIIKKMRKNHSIGICASKINYYENSNIIWSNGGVFNKIFGHVKHIDYNKQDKGQYPSCDITFLTGCMWVMKKELFYDIGLLNEEYFMYVEDVEYVQKVLNNGYTLAVESESIIYHKVGSSSGGEVSLFSSYWMMRNKVKYILENQNIFYQTTNFLFLIVTRLIKFPIYALNGNGKIIFKQLEAIFDAFHSKK